MQAAIEQGTLRREDIEALARRFEVCPYELARDLLPWVDVIIADLHYVYSLTAGLGSTMETEGWRSTVLLDEAHNLPSRARAMYSAALAKDTVLQARNSVGGSLARSLTRINRQFFLAYRTSGRKRRSTVVRTYQVAWSRRCKRSLARSQSSWHRSPRFYSDTRL